MNKAVRGIVALVVAAALALTGCSQPPGAAAVVNGVEIPDTVAREAATVVAAQLGMPESTVLPQVVFDLTMGEASAQIAAANDIEVSQAEIDETLALDARVQALADVPGSDVWADSVATTYVVIQELGTEQYAEQLRAMPITVNPRYGTWDPQNVDLADSSLSEVYTPSLR